MSSQRFLQETVGRVRTRERDVVIEVEVGAVMLLALKGEEEATSQGIQVASRSWKRQGNRFSPRVSRRNAAPPTNFKLLISKIINNIVLL